jgi:hypothetical protein
VLPVNLTNGGGGGSGRSQMITWRESLVLYKSFNTLWEKGKNRDHKLVSKNINTMEKYVREKLLSFTVSEKVFKQTDFSHGPFTLKFPSKRIWWKKEN